MKKITAFKHRFQRIALQLCLVIVLTAVQPWLWGRLEAQSQAVHRQRSDHAQLASLQARIVQIKQANTAQQGLLDQLDVVVPRQESLPQAVERLERIAIETQAQLDILDIAEIVGTPDESDAMPLTPVRVTIQAMGNTGQLLQVIDQIEHIQEIAMIEQWALTPVVVVEAGALPIPEAARYQLVAQVVFFLQNQSDGQ